MTHEVLEAVGVLAGEMGRRAYLVGGIVRDIAIGYPNTDLDITIEGDGVEVARSFARKTGAAFKGATRFGTCKLESKALGVIDFATTRAESYRKPGALPDVRPSGLEHDLARRDFTINAMAISLSPDDYGRLVDPYDGLGDIERRKVRILHDASFNDDPTRILRAIRFASRYGFRLERKTRGLADTCIADGCIGTISGKRVFAELRLICMEEKAAVALRMLEELGALGAIAPELGRRGGLEHPGLLAASLDVAERLAGEAFVSRWICWFSLLFAGVGRAGAEDMIAYFNLPKNVREACRWVARDLPRTRAALLRLDVSDAYALTTRLRKIHAEGLVHLYAGSSARVRAALRKYLAEWRNVKPSLTGGDLVRMGIGEGPLVGKMVEHLLEGKLRGKFKTRADEITYVKRRLTRH